MCGILSESWLIAIIEYMAFDITTLWPAIHVARRLGLARPDQSANHAKLSHYVFVALGRWLGSVD